MITRHLYDEMSVAH